MSVCAERVWHSLCLEVSTMQMRHTWMSHGKGVTKSLWLRLPGQSLYHTKSINHKVLVIQSLGHTKSLSGSLNDADESLMNESRPMWQDSTYCDVRGKDSRKSLSGSLNDADETHMNESRPMWQDSSYCDVRGKDSRKSLFGSLVCHHSNGVCAVFSQKSRICSISAKEPYIPARAPRSCVLLPLCASFVGRGLLFAHNRCRACKKRFLVCKGLLFAK